MDAKKSPKFNLEKKRTTFLLIGLVVILSVVYATFEWGNSTNNQAYVPPTIPDVPEEIIPNTIDLVKPKLPDPPKQTFTSIKVVPDGTKTDDTQFTSESQPEDQVDLSQMTIKPAVDEGDDENKIFRIVEDKPTFPGGDEALLKYVYSNIHYPIIALQNGIEGKVVCEFTVFKDGSVGNITVLKSADQSLDKEAMRVIQSMPKWNPGMQRKKPVNCMFTLPVIFQIQNQ